MHGDIPHCEPYAHLYYLSTSHRENNVHMSHPLQSGVSGGGFRRGWSAIFFAYISIKTFPMPDGIWPYKHQDFRPPDRAGDMLVSSVDSPRNI